MQVLTPRCLPLPRPLPAQRAAGRRNAVLDAEVRPRCRAAVPCAHFACSVRLGEVVADSPLLHTLQPHHIQPLLSAVSASTKQLLLVRSLLPAERAELPNPDPLAFALHVHEAEAEARAGAEAAGLSTELDGASEVNMSVDQDADA